MILAYYLPYGKLFHSNIHEYAAVSLNGFEMVHETVSSIKQCIELKLFSFSPAMLKSLARTKRHF